MAEKAGKERRGFASMSTQRQREIAALGGRAAHAKGTAHQWTSEEAREAGRRGGRVSRGGRGRALRPEERLAAGNTVRSQRLADDIADDHHDVSRFHDEGNPNG